MSDLGEEPLVDWEVGFGMRSSELHGDDPVVVVELLR